MISTELVDLSRLQFAATAMYHYLFVPLTLGALVRPAQNEEEKVLKKRFTEMAVLSFSVAAVSFLIGYALKTVTGIKA